jgi:predicted CXXCH cytochrome family protein
MFAESDDQVCGSCHSRGESPDGLSFPATYRPGDNLADHFSFTTDESALWPDGSAKKHHQQYMDWQLGSDMSLSEETSCTTCHSVHDSGAEQSQLKKPVGELCVECHSEKKALYKHTPYHEQAREEKEFTCVDCHMPTMATSAVPFDIHNHSFKQPDPQATVEYGGVDIMPNACNLCHTGRDEGPEWAAQTIAYVKKVSPKRASLGPGPTPTPPPPPTPLPSVGQPAEPVSVQTWGWVRTTAFAVMILGLAAILFLVFRSLRSRRSANG